MEFALEDESLGILTFHLVTIKCRRFIACVLLLKQVDRCCPLLVLSFTLIPKSSRNSYLRFLLLQFQNGLDIASHLTHAGSSTLIPASFKCVLH